MHGRLCRPRYPSQPRMAGFAARPDQGNDPLETETDRRKGDRISLSMLTGRPKPNSPEIPCCYSDLADYIVARNTAEELLTIQNPSAAKIF